MSTDFTEGEPQKTAPPSPANTEISAGAPETAPAPSPHQPEGDDLPRRSVKHDSDDRIVGIIAHWAGYLTWIFAPLIMYLVQKDRRSLAAWHAREAMNFQITILIYLLLPMPLFCLNFMAIVDQSPMWIVIGTLVPTTILMLLAIYELAMIIWASVAAYQGKYFKIPLNIPFVPRGPVPTHMEDHADLE